MDTTPRVDGHTSLPSDTRTNSGVSSLDPTVVNLLRNNFGFSLGAKNLDSHSADASGPQGSRSAPAQKSEFQSLIEEAKKYEGRQIGNFNIEVAKQDFSQISNKSDFFRAAFRAIALPGNEAEVANNIKHLLRLSQGNITIELIIDEFKNIGDVDRRIEFLDKLKVNLSGEEKTEFKDFLTGALDGVADQIADEFEKSQNKDKAALFEKLKSVDLLKIALLAEEKVGVPFLARLINDNKLPSLELAELDLQTLQQLDFAKLLQEKLAELVVDLISSDPPQSDKLLQLIDDQKILLDVFRALPELSLDQSIKIVCILLEHGADGVNCLVGLINDKKLPLDVFPALPVLSQSQSINIVCVLLKCGSEGLNYLADLINNGKLPNLSMGDSSASKKFNCYLLARGQSGLAVVKALIGKGKLDPKQFKEQDAKEFAGALFMNGSSGADYAIDLINMSMLPNFSLVDSSESKKFARYFLSQGAPGLGAIKTLVEEKKLDPTKFSPEDAKEFVDALFMNGSSGADYAIDLINMSMLPNLASQDAVSAHVSMLQTLQSTLKGGITKAFPGGTRARDLTLAKARGIWPTIANEVAASCFGTNGEVDIDKLKGWTVLLGDEEIFKTEPYCLIPHAELMRSQMYTACESLLNNKNKERDLLNAAKGIRVGQHGRAILDTMSNGRTQSLTPPVAILSSLFTPHRQKSLPTCTIN
ncbi:MAG: hypothetical protein LBQ23_03195, partial [Puniceicoccales bacterium]|nr:hypothetical protein [Puniceicoccales bacterium]